MAPARGALSRDPLARDPLVGTALYYIVGGLWPIVHLRSFMAVTGRKRDGWLVQTFGLFLAALGAGLFPQRPAERPAQERIAVLGAASLAAADAFFVARRRISPIYLADAAVEVGLIAWIMASRGVPRAEPEGS
jgi:hypothetical protein